MRVLALDIWHDLRQKRLWPLAVLLLAAIVAALAFALRPGSEEPVPAPAAAPSAGTVGGTGVRLTDEPLGGSSGLERFGSRDPFTGGPAAPAEPGASGAAAAAGAAGASQPVPDGGGLSAPAAPPPPSGGTAGVSTPPAPPPGSPASPVSSSTSKDEGSGGSGERRVVRKLRYFSHEADVVFGPAGSLRRHDGLEPLELLTEKDPVLLFSGVTMDGTTAVFSLLRPELAVKGGCVEVLDRCQLLYLEEGERRRLEPPEDDPTGDAYVLRLVDIRTARIDP